MGGLRISTTGAYRDRWTAFLLATLVETHLIEILSYNCIFVTEQQQLWWGHRIPVWYVNDDRETYVVARNEEEALVTAK